MSHLFIYMVPLLFSVFPPKNDGPVQLRAEAGETEVKILADVVKGNWSYSEIVANQTVKIHGSEKMHWRGECFLAAGL